MPRSAPPVLMSLWHTHPKPSTGLSSYRVPSAPTSCQPSAVEPCTRHCRAWGTLRPSSPPPCTSPSRVADMHRIFQRDLCKLHLETSRAFVRLLQDGQGPLAGVLSATLQLTAQVSPFLLPFPLPPPPHFLARAVNYNETNNRDSLAPKQYPRPSMARYQKAFPVVISAFFFAMDLISPKALFLNLVYPCAQIIVRDAMNTPLVGIAQ